MNRRAQAALEFLTTYGWAFLIIIVMIAAIAYFGILKPEKVLPNRCLVGSEFSCEDFLLDGSAGTLTFQLKQGVGKTIFLNDVSCISYDIDPPRFASTVTVNAAAIVPPQSWSPRSPISVVCTFNPNIVAKFKGNKLKIAFNLTYRLSSGGLLHTAEGEVYSEVQ